MTPDTKPGRYRNAADVAPQLYDRVRGTSSGATGTVVATIGGGDERRVKVDYDEGDRDAERQKVYQKPQFFEYIGRISAVEYDALLAQRTHGQASQAETKGEDMARIFSTDHDLTMDHDRRLKEIEAKVQTFGEQIRGLFESDAATDEIIGNTDELDDTLAQLITDGDGDRAALWEYAKQTAEMLAKLRTRVDNMERREGNSAAGINSMAQTVAEVRKALDRAEDRLQHVTRTEAERNERLARRVSTLESQLADANEAIQTLLAAKDHPAATQFDVSSSYARRLAAVEMAASSLCRDVRALDGVADTVGMHTTRLNGHAQDVDALRTDLALLARSQLRHAGFTLRTGISDSEAVDALKTHMWRADHSHVKQAADALESTPGEAPATIGDIANLRAAVDMLANGTTQNVEMLTRRLAKLESFVHEGARRAKELRKGPKSYDKRIERLETLATLADRVHHAAGERMDSIEASLQDASTDASTAYERDQAIGRRILNVEERLTARLNAWAKETAENADQLRGKASADSLASAWREIGNLARKVGQTISVPGVVKSFQHDAQTSEHARAWQDTAGMNRGPRTFTVHTAAGDPKSVVFYGGVGDDSTAQNDDETPKVCPGCGSLLQPNGAYGCGFTWRVLQENGYRRRPDGSIARPGEA